MFFGPFYKNVKIYMWKCPHFPPTLKAPPRGGPGLVRGGQYGEVQPGHAGLGCSAGLDLQGPQSLLGLHRHQCRRGG